MEYIFELHKKMVEHDLILLYEGQFTQEITKSVLAMAERNMDAIGEESSIKRKVFNVMVEALQNIVKHAGEAAEDSIRGSAIFLLGKNDTEYAIMSGNPISDDKVDFLGSKMEEINALDKDGLKKLYKEIIKGGDLSEKGGAGLGFVDMARKSGQPLDYNFSPLGGGYQFFSMKATIAKG